MHNEHNAFEITFSKGEPEIAWNQIQFRIKMTGKDNIPDDRSQTSL